MPAPQTTATPARLVDAGPQQREGVVADRTSCVPQPRACDRRSQLLLLDGQVGVGQAGRDVVDDGPSVAGQPGRRRRPRRPAAPRPSTAASAPTDVRLEAAAAGRAEHRAVGARRAPRRSCCCRRRWRGRRHGRRLTSRPRRCSRLCAISRSVSPSASSTWPTSGWASSASKTRSRPPSQRGVEGQVLVRRHVRDQAGVQRVDAARRAAASAPVGVDPGRHLDHARRRAGTAACRCCAMLTTCTDRRRRPCRAATTPGPRPPRSSRRRRAWSSSAGFSSSAGSAYSSSSSLLDRGDLGGPRRLASAARAPPRRARRSSAGSTTGRRRAGRSERGAAGSRSAAIVVAVVGQQLRAARPRRRRRDARRSQVRWLRPTWSSCDLGRARRRAARRTGAGSRSPRCTARPPGGRPGAGPG